MTTTVFAVTEAERIDWLEMALKAIADMNLDEAQNYEHLSALMVAIARTALAHDSTLTAHA